MYCIQYITLNDTEHFAKRQFDTESSTMVDCMKFKHAENIYGRAITFLYQLIVGAKRTLFVLLFASASAASSKLLPGARLEYKLVCLVPTV